MKGLLHKNKYPHDFVDKCIKNFLGKVLTQKVVVSAVPKKDLMIVLPYLGHLSLPIRTIINRVMKNNLPTAIVELICDFLKFDWCKMLNGYVDFSFNNFSLRMTVASVKPLKN